MKEAEEKKAKEEQIKQDRLNQMKKAIAEQREYVKRKKEEKKIQEKKEDAEFVDDWKRKMKQLEEDEKQEYLALRERNRNLAEYQKMQYDEKKKLALKQFEQLNEDSYKTKMMLDKEEEGIRIDCDEKILKHLWEDWKMLKVVREFVEGYKKKDTKE